MTPDILFVCTGNTCRSPMAEAIAKHEAKNRGLTLTISSAGTSADGSNTTQASIDALATLGISLPSKPSVSFSPGLVGPHTRVLTMTASHLRSVTSKGVEASMLREADVEDPMITGRYTKVAGELRDAILAYFEKHYPRQ